MTTTAAHTPSPAPHASAEQTVFFGIPLKARATAKNWEWTVRDFNRTLASIYNQTNPNFVCGADGIVLHATYEVTGGSRKAQSFLKRRAAWVHGRTFTLGMTTSDA